MLLEVLESVIFLETLPFVKWYYTELANVDSHTKNDWRILVPRINIENVIKFGFVLE
jgi:hypothetical protein